MPSRHLPVLDGWRGCAILFVLVGHFARARGINLGRFGVELFFVLSGRLMAEILFVRAIPLRVFFLRRFSRIYPTLLCFVSVMAVAVAVYENTKLSACIAALTLTYNYYRIWFGELPVVDHVWSLCVEEHLYILLGTLALIWRRWKFPLLPALLGLALLACLSGFISTAFGMAHTSVYWRSDVRGASILFGAAAYLWIRERVDAETLPAILPVSLLVVGLCLNLNIVPDPLKYSLGSICLAGAVALISIAPSSIRRTLEKAPFLGFGVWSYSIYLWQQPFYVERDSMDNAAAPLFVAPAIMVGILSLKFIEYPTRAFLNAKIDKLRSFRPTGTQASMPNPEPGLQN